MDGQVPRNFPGFFARPLEFCAFESDFGVLGGIEKLIAFHMLVENGHKGFDTVRLEGHRELTFLGITLIVKKFAVIASEVSALAANAEMVPAEPHLGVHGVERVSLRVRPSVQVETARTASPGPDSFWAIRP